MPIKEKRMDMVNVVLDMKGLSCPRPLIGAKRMVDELATGQVLLLVSDCPGTQDDLFPVGPAKQAAKIAGLPQPLGKGGY